MRNKDRQKEYNKIYNAKHKAEKLAYNTRYNIIHQDDRRAKRKIYQEAHKTERKAYDAAHREEKKAWRLAHKRRCKGYDLKKYYNLTIDEYDRLVEKCHGCCEICRKPAKLYVDHNHSTGVVRGLLCHLCNNILGAAQDNPETLANSVQYLLDRG